MFFNASIANALADWLHTEKCRSYRSYKYIPFTHYQSLHNSYIVYTMHDWLQPEPLQNYSHQSIPRTEISQEDC